MWALKALSSSGTLLREFKLLRQTKTCHTFNDYLFFSFFDLRNYNIELLRTLINNYLIIAPNSKNDVIESLSLLILGGADFAAQISL